MDESKDDQQEMRHNNRRPDLKTQILVNRLVMFYANVVLHDEDDAIESREQEMQHFS